MPGKSDRSKKRPNVGEGLWDAVTQVKGRMMYRKTICWPHEPFHAERHYPLRRFPRLQSKGRKTQRAWEQIVHSQIGNAGNGKGNGTAELFLRRQWFRPKAVLA